MPSEMASNLTDNKPEDIALDERPAFLSSAPRSGELSPYAQKIAAEAFVWLCSLVVLGATANFAAIEDKCTPLCRFGIATGVVSALICTALLLKHALTWFNRITKASLNAKTEKDIMIFITLWWTIGIACLSAYTPAAANSRIPVLHTSSVGIVFGWLAFFGSVYGSFKSWHAVKEEQKLFQYDQVRTLRAAEEEEFANFS